jgi:hypothetical protein
MSAHLIQAFLEALKTLVIINQEIAPFSRRSDHKCGISEAKKARQAARHRDASADIIYDEAVADFDSIDFLPYTPDYLAQHSQTIERYADSFNCAVNAFHSIPQSDPDYADCVSIFTTAIEMFGSSVDSYLYATHCSQIDAITGDKTILEARLMRYRLAMEQYQNGEISKDALARNADEIMMQQEGEIRIFERFLAQANTAELRAKELDAAVKSAGHDVGLR